MHAILSDNNYWSVKEKLKNKGEREMNVYCQTFDCSLEASWPYDSTDETRQIFYSAKLATFLTEKGSN